MTVIPRRALRLGLPAAGVALLAILPFSTLSAGGLLPGPFNSPGTLQTLALIFIAVAAAITYDVLFGYAGLLSFGHALYFAIGCYGTVLFTNSESLGLGVAVLLALALTFVCAVAGNAAALRLSGMGFAMATLALAQLMYIGVERGYFGTGGEFGVTFTRDTLPGVFVGLINTRNAYWLALALVVVVYLVCSYVVRSQIGHVWQAIRENPVRVEFLGYSVYLYRLAAAVFSSTLAGVCGVVYAVVMGGASPNIVVLGYSLSFILMVVLGGRGVLWGAVLGGVLYTFLNLRLTALSSLPAIDELPAFVSAPISEPNFLLGLVFVIVILTMPGGLASLFTGRAGARRRKRAVEPGSSRQAAAPGALEPVSVSGRQR